MYDTLNSRKTWTAVPFNMPEMGIRAIGCGLNRQCYAWVTALQFSDDPTLFLVSPTNNNVQIVYPEVYRPSIWYRVEMQCEDSLVCSSIFLSSSDSGNVSFWRTVDGGRTWEQTMFLKSIELSSLSYGNIMSCPTLHICKVVANVYPTGGSSWNAALSIVTVIDGKVQKA